MPDRAGGKKIEAAPNATGYQIGPCVGGREMRCALVVQIGVGLLRNEAAPDAAGEQTGPCVGG